MLLFPRKRGLLVRSYGAGQQVKLPGSSLEKPNVYTFDTPYEVMYKELSNKDRDLYTQNGVLHMLDRNRRIKEKPERFQDSRDKFDVIFTVEERIFDQVIEGSRMMKIENVTIRSCTDLENRDKRTNEIVHVINIDVIDNAEDATLGAFLLCELGQKVDHRCSLVWNFKNFLSDGRCRRFG